jgi:hypothetical protein
MQLHRIDRRQLIPISITEAWEFFSNPMNLSKIKPPWLNFKVVSEIDQNMHSGMIITYQITPIAFMPTLWVSEITHVKISTFLKMNSDWVLFDFGIISICSRRSVGMSKYRISFTTLCLYGQWVRSYILSLLVKKSRLFLNSEAKRWNEFYFKRCSLKKKLHNRKVKFEYLPFL